MILKKIPVMRFQMWSSLIVITIQILAGVQELYVQADRSWFDVQCFVRLRIMSQYSDSTSLIDFTFCVQVNTFYMCFPTRRVPSEIDDLEKDRSSSVHVREEDVVFICSYDHHHCTGGLFCRERHLRHFVHPVFKSSCVDDTSELAKRRPDQDRVIWRSRSVTSSSLRRGSVSHRDRFIIVVQGIIDFHNELRSHRDRLRFQ